MAMTFMGGRSNYPYAVARVQAKRSKLIPTSEYEKILNMDVAEITRYIEDSAYRTEVDELAGRFEGLDLLEAALTVNEERTFASVRKMLAGPGGAIVENFLARFVVDNLKTIIRGKNAGASRDELLKELLLEDLDTYGMFEPLLGDDVRTPRDIATVLGRLGGEAATWSKVLLDVPEDAPMSAYEDALDRAYYGRMIGFLQTRKDRGSQAFLRFARREIDSRNLLNAARWVAAKQEGDFSGFAIPNGLHLKVGKVVELSRSGSLDAFADALQDNPLYEGVKDGLDEARQTGRLSPFQAAVRRSLESDLGRIGHEIPLSVLPILLFLIQKHNEVVALRAIARGKAAGLSEKRLRELLP